MDSPVDSSPFLVKTKGAEIGLRTKLVPGSDQFGRASSCWISASEILFVGDAGDTEASRPSRRVGFEWTNDYKPTSWLSLEADLAMTRARFRGSNADQAAAYAELDGYPASQIGNAPGNFIPGAPQHDRLGWHPAGRGHRLVWRLALSLTSARVR